jgi:signal transduction histidine kinase
MMQRTSLKFRILVALVLIVSVTSLLFAGGVLLIKARLEASIFGDMVAAQMRLLTAQLEDGSYHADALFTGWKFYFGEATAQLPREITALAPGSHHSVAAGDFIYQVEVGEWDGRPAYLTYDVTEWENQEHAVLRMLLYGLLLVLVVAIGMGLTAIRAILAPVQTLSERLTQIEPGQASLRLAADYAGTEIGQIAASFDKYQERLEKFVERERSFTAAASHELRTPLAVMMGALDVLSANPQSPASQRALERISRACAEMLAFIEATLLLSREESNQIDQGAAADVVALVERTLDDHAAQITERSLVIVRDYIGTPVLAQPASLVQITVGNLLRNAIEHTRDGRIEIRIEDSLIAIRDTGEGIPADKLAQVFDRSYSTKASGTGLGLNLVKRICDRFHWTITLESAPGRGTLATVRFQ